MKLLSLLLCLLLSAVAATEELTSATFASMVNSGKNGMIKYYQEWCGHCKRMKPDWDKLAEEANSGIFIRDVNCGTQDKLCKEHGVAGYPTIKYYLDGHEHSYEGGRSFEVLMDFVRDNLMPKCDIVNNLKGTCTEKAQKYATKWLAKDFFDVQKESKRLAGMLSKTMKPDLVGWVKERIQILSQITVDFSDGARSGEKEL